MINKRQESQFIRRESERLTKADAKGKKAGEAYRNKGLISLVKKKMAKRMRDFKKTGWKEDGFGSYYLPKVFRK